MGDIIERIAAWEAAGLIDRATADRLREAETEPSGTPTEASSQVAALFGPSVTIPEVFGYLGTAFLLAAWTAFVTRTSFGTDQTAIGPGIGGVVAAVVLVALGFVLRRGDEPRRIRSAGVAFLVAVAYVAGGIAALASAAGLDGSQAAVIGGGVALAVAIGLRWIHPAVLTQVALLGAITGLAAAMLAWFQSVLVPGGPYKADGSLATGGPDPLILAVASAIWWLACAVLIGLIGLAEARAAERGDAGAGRRAAVTRFWAGIVAVVGVAMAVTRSDVKPNGEYGRVMNVWVGDLAILAVSAVLLERAFRRDSTAYVYAAALGLILALSDFNATYLSQSTEVGLAIEGVILLGVGLAADRLRRRIERSGHDRVPALPTGDIDPAPAVALEPSTEAPEAPQPREPGAVEPPPASPPA